MLANRRVFPTVPAADMDRAKSWYQDKLGLAPQWEDDQLGAIYELGGTGFLLYPTENAGKSPNTLMSFESTNVDEDVTALKARGVAFMDIAEGEMKTVNSVATIGGFQGAWFNDSEGNIIAIGNDPMQ